MRPFKRRIISYDGHRWEVMDDRGTWLLIERSRGAYAHWVHRTLVVDR